MTNDASTQSFLDKLSEEERRDEEFKKKLIELLKKNNLGTSEDIAFLEGLVQGR